jgi:uncharacterized membrane protein
VRNPEIEAMEVRAKRFMKQAQFICALLAVLMFSLGIFQKANRVGFFFAGVTLIWNLLFSVYWPKWYRKIRPPDSQ